MPSNENSPFEWLIEEIAARLAQSLGAMTGEDTTGKYLGPQSSATEGIIWWEQAISFPPGGTLYVGASDSTMAALGGKVLEIAGVPADDETIRSTYFETLAQAMSATVRTLSGRFGREVTCGKGTKFEGRPVDADGPFRIGLTVAGEELCEMYASVGRAFRSLVLSAVPAVQETAPKDTDPGPQPPVAEQAVVSKRMDVLFDVELPVSVSFGRAQLPLKDVIKLTTGSIIELNRTVTEPVEIIVNNCVIARGEVVVVEGNYGVRIDQIITRQERLRTVS